MDIFSLSSTAHYSHTPPPPPFAAVKHHLPPTTTTTTTSISSFILTSKSSQDSPYNNPTTTISSSSAGLRRPTTKTKIPLKTPSSHSTQLPENPLKNLINSKNTPIPVNKSPPHDTLSSKLWLSSKLSPPPPTETPPPPLPSPLPENNSEDETEDGFFEKSEENDKEMEFREKGKIFVGNLPLWIHKNEVAEFFRQFGPLKNVILIKGHDDVERNMGFGFVIYNGDAAEKAAMKAVEFDGVEFHGRVLTVKLDNGMRLKGKSAERVRWVEGRKEDREEYRSTWHEERDGSRKEFWKVVESRPENWQAVVTAFERIKKVKLVVDAP